MKPTMKDMIMDVFNRENRAFAPHEFFEYGIIHNDHSISARLNELEREGKLKSRYREGKNYKEWYVEEVINA